MTTEKTRTAAPASSPVSAHDNSRCTQFELTDAGETTPIRQAAWLMIDEIFSTIESPMSSAILS